MQKIFDGGQVVRGKVISATPKTLRSLAALLENMAKSGQTNDAIFLPIGGDVILYYEPSLESPESPIVLNEIEGNL